MASIEGAVAPGGSPGPTRDVDMRGGVIAALLAYFMWGLFPLLFKMLDTVSPLIVVSHRIVWSLVFVAIIVRLNGRIAEVWAALRDRRVLMTIALGAVFLTVNWLVYVWGVSIDRVLETSLGYFILPLVNVLIGMVLLGERQNLVQWVAIAIAAVGVAVQTWSVGGVPWIALILAFSFGIYGYIRKTVKVGSVPGLMVETLLLVPIALAYLVFSFVTMGPGPHANPSDMMWLLITGPATAGALIFFAYGARQLRLTTIGMFQYLAPSMHFLIAVFLFKEPLSGWQLFSFVLIWVSLMIFSGDSWLRGRQREMKANG